MRGVLSLSAFLRGEGWGEGLYPRRRLELHSRRPPSPGLHLRCNPTSPRKRGEVKRASSNYFAFLAFAFFALAAFFAGFSFAFFSGFAAMGVLAAMRIERA